MMVRGQRITWKLLRSPATAGIFLLAACGTSKDAGPGVDAGSDVTASSGGDSGSDAASPGTDAGTDSGADVGAPPTDGASLLDAAGDAATDTGPVCAPPTGTTFAMTQLLFGDGNSGQWKSFGFNIDGQVWTSGSTTHCQPSSGASPSTVFPNGNNG